MKIGIPKEIKRHEYRIAASPAEVAEYVRAGHEVCVQRSAGEGAGFSDDQYRLAGATIGDTAEEVYGHAEMVVKVKEPQECEYELLRAGQILYGYLHLAACPELSDVLIERKVTGVAYETIQLADGSLPCLAPMSEIAGRLATQEGAKYLEKPFGGRGVLLGGVPGVPAANVGIIGGGTVGTNAAKMAVGLGAKVTILDISHSRLVYLDDIFGGRIETLFSTRANIEHILSTCDLVIGAVLVPGASAPKLIKRDDLKLMKQGAVIVDVAVDQGGCTETTHATTHDDPVYTVDGIVHYCVANMPGAVSVTSTMALAHQTLQFGLELANMGLEKAVKNNKALRAGVNVYDGHVVHRAVAESLNLPYQEMSWLDPTNSTGKSLKPSAPTAGRATRVSQVL